MGICFWLIGVTVGVWVARIPEIQRRLALDDGRLGFVLLMSALGALVAMPIAGRLAPRAGSRFLVWLSAGCTCVTLPLIAWAPTPGTLMVVFAIYGASTGIHGVAINALGVDVEQGYGRPILSGFHGLFSLGGLMGSLIAAGCLAGSIAPLPSLLGATLGIACLYLVAAPFLPTTTIRPASTSTGPPEGKLSLFRRSSAGGRLVALGGFAFLGLMGEGSMGDWSAVYLDRSLHAAPALASLGYAAYSLGMTSGRFAGDRLTRRLGDMGLLRVGASLAVVGLCLAVGLGRPIPAVVGFTLVGLGLANAVPILYRAASRTPGVEPVAGIALTSTVGYLGFLVGPPLIGLIAARTTLGTALGVVAAAIAIVALGGGVVCEGNEIEADRDQDLAPVAKM